MSDVTLNCFLASGSAAEMAAWVPTPPTPVSGPDYGYLFRNTTDDTLYFWDGAAWTPASASGSGDVVGPAASVASELVLFDGATGKLVKRATGTGFVTATSGVYAAAALTQTVGMTFDGGGAPITTGIKGDLTIPFACTITAVTLLADQSGDVVLDIWKDTYANFPPTVADTITASAKPTITAAVKSQDVTLTGWTTSIAAGDTLRFTIDSLATITRLAVQLTVTRTS